MLVDIEEDLVNPKIDLLIPPSNTDHLASNISQVPSDITNAIKQAATLLGRVKDLRTPLLCVNLDLVKEQYQLLRNSAPHVIPHYAIKCYSDERIVKLLDGLGCCFDAAGGGELVKLESWGIDPKKVIVTKPIRKPEDLIAIARYKPRALVVKDPIDLKMLKMVGIPNANYSPEIILRVVLPFGKLSLRFGAEIADYTLDQFNQPRWQLKKAQVRALFAQAQQIEHSTGHKYGAFGLTSHVGTNNTDSRKYEILLALFSELISEEAKCGLNIKIVDLGGGLPDKVAPLKSGITQEQFMLEFGKVTTCFAEQNPNLELINEPGRFLVANSGFCVVGVTRVDERDQRFTFDGKIEKVRNHLVEVDDSLYLHYLGRWHEGDLIAENLLKLKEYEFYPFRIGKNAPLFSKNTIKAALNGASCDSADYLGEVHLPEDIKAGDYLLTPNMGAYVADTRVEDFNSLQTPQTCFYTVGESGPIVHTLLDEHIIDPDEYRRLLTPVDSRLEVIVESSNDSKNRSTHVTGDEATPHHRFVCPWDV